MSHVLPLTFEPVLQQIRLEGFFSSVVKRATSLFNSFCSKVAKQVARFMSPVLLYLKTYLRTEYYVFSFFFSFSLISFGKWLEFFFCLVKREASFMISYVLIFACTWKERGFVTCSAKNGLIFFPSEWILQSVIQGVSLISLSATLR